MNDPVESNEGAVAGSSPVICSLRPCPFCGGSARFCGDESEEINVICDDCEATVEGISKEAAAKTWNRRCSYDEPRRIGDIANYYGGLSVKIENGKCFWSIENYDGDNWSEIPRQLFDALNQYQEDFSANT